MKKLKIPHKIIAYSALSCFVASGLYGQEESEEEDVFELSPFEVKSSEDDFGYRATNTLAGSRLNTNLADIGASITVVTKSQMDDTASTDLNDLFRYEASTEGSSTYTPGVMSMRGDGVVDVNAGFANGGTGIPQTNATANTVRGLGAPDSSINFYRSISQIPLDTYNVQSVEISRGPNSMLFGIGTPAGVVNQSRSSAALSEDAYGVKMKIDDLGSTRFSLSANKVLIDDKLGFFVAALQENKEFARKPSYDDAERYYGTFTYKPYKGAKLTASMENMSRAASRPNSLTPRDVVTEWRDAGMPMYNPVDRTITSLTTGKVVGPITRSTQSINMDAARDFVMSQPGYDASLWNDDQTSYDGVRIYGDPYRDDESPFYMPGINRSNSRPTMQFADGQIVNWFQAQPGRYRFGWGTEEDPTANQNLGQQNADLRGDPITAPVYDQIWTSSALWSGNGNGIGGYAYPGVTDRSIYDWENLNLLEMNWGEEDAQTYNIEFEQKLTENLHFSAGWFRQEFDSYSSFTVSQLNVATLYVDTNSHLPDGTVNPYAGAVYMEDQDPDRFYRDITNDQYRGILAYTPDFTGNDNWTKWLGKHQFVAYGSREFEVRKTVRMRTHFDYESEEPQSGMIRFLPNPNDNADGTPTGFRNRGSFSRRSFYLSPPNLDVADYGRALVSSGQDRSDKFSAPMSVYNWEAKEWQDVNYVGRFKAYEAGTGASETEIDSWNFGGTSHLWDGRIVATYGVRSDQAGNRSATKGAILDFEGNVIEPALETVDYYSGGDFLPEMAQTRFRPWTNISDETTTTGVVFRPFSNWDGIKSRAKEGSLFHQFLDDLGFTYNVSETFDPQSSVNVDFFGRLLPKPGGDGKDIGVQFSLFDRKLFARVNYYQSSNANQHVSAGAAGSRFIGQIDQNQFRAWANVITKINWGLDPRINDEFNAELTTEQEERLERESELIWGLPYDYYADLPGSIMGTRSVSAEGTELQLTYNPMKNWTIKVTGSKQETIYDDVLNEYLEWKEVRMPQFLNAKASDYLLPEYQDLATYVTEGGTEVNLTNFWNSYGYTSAARITDENGNTSIEGYFNNIVTPQEAVALDLSGQVITNQPKYQASLISNYKVVDGKFGGTSFGGSLRWIDKKSIGYYGKSSGDPSRDEGYLDLTDTTRPIFTPAQTYYDFWAAYAFPIWDGKADMKVQLNVVNAFEGGGLQTVGVNKDGSPHAFRIIEPRRFVLSLSLNM
ncbi:TonB-dependent receptor plug domain-containing protein [Pelagicoccus albus]|uniref:TonB-dependent receptor plug domain-containing protein n=1 Tax=Pelagicoccus albus TaxID=415222 RepID=A0A7X1B5Q5_9BACT|nr:TonB-dependent receptor plug domain-containing protein [Pelagicoccus albus]MBC2606115.1 TonB-dependent receptor plug domain-containing protein [Pelagicoccus albus]